MINIFYIILKGTNLDALLEAITTLAELHDLKAKRECPAEGVVLESRKDKGKGYMFEIAYCQWLQDRETGGVHFNVW